MTDTSGEITGFFQYSRTDKPVTDKSLEYVPAKKPENPDSSGIMSNPETAEKLNNFKDSNFKHPALAGNAAPIDASKFTIDWNMAYQHKNKPDLNGPAIYEINLPLSSKGKMNEYFLELQDNPDKILNEFNAIFGTNFTAKELGSAARLIKTGLLDGIQTITWFEKGYKELNPIAAIFNKSKHNPGMVLIGAIFIYMSLRTFGGIKNEKHRKQWMFVATVLEALNVYYNNMRYWSPNEIYDPTKPGKENWTRTYPVIQIKF